MPDVPIRLILADDHSIVLHGLQQFLEGRSGFTVMACCRNAEEALATVRHTPADVLILDLRMPGGNGLDVLRVVAREQPLLRVVLLTAVLRDQEAQEAIRLGARGIVLKESAPDDLVECLRRVHAGEQWIDRVVLGRAFAQSVDASAGREAQVALTTRELEVVRMAAAGLRNRDIAQQLGISEGTVKIHLHNAYEKLGVGGRVELVLYLQDKGFV